MFSKKHGHISQVSGYSAQECEMHLLIFICVIKNTSPYLHGDNQQPEYRDSCQVVDTGKTW